MNHPIRSSRRAIQCAFVLSSMLPLMAQACSGTQVVGTICTFAFDWCPKGFLAASGGVVPIQGNQDLFTVIGTAFGGDGRTTFGLPDLRGRAVVGVGIGVDPATMRNLAPVSLNEPVGQQSLALNINQAPVPTHTHGATFTPTYGTQPVTLPATAGTLAVSAALLPNRTSITAPTATPPAGDVYLTNVVVVTSGSATVSGPYTTVAPSGASSLPATVAVDGAGSTSATTATLRTLVGGTVQVGTNADSRPAPVSVQSPGLGMNMCIVASGIMPVAAQ